MKIVYKTGDLMNFTEDAFGHGCNCFKRMASGVAASVKKVYPEMVQVDLQNTLTPEQKLGTFTYVILKNAKFGYNIYSQFNYGTDKVNVDYNALENGLRFVCLDLKSKNLKTLALPMIGSGLAGGKWSVIEPIIEKISNETEIEISVYIYNGKTIEEIREQEKNMGA